MDHSWMSGISNVALLQVQDLQPVEHVVAGVHFGVESEFHPTMHDGKNR